jgi:tetrapyrrole methylase family protein/MazG family protein
VRFVQTDYIQELVAILERLRGPGGCPWDREQTHASLKRFLIEECGELLDALDDGDDSAIVDELGDVLLQLVFHGQIGSEEGRFTLQDAARSECEKMRRRHPHVFGDTQAATSADVVDQWDRLKRDEERHARKTSAVDGVPRQLPALHRAQAVLRKAGKVGFEWPTVAGAWAKVREELAEAEEACQSGDPGRTAEELGDLLLAVTNLCRWYHLEAEDVLQQGVRKFIGRFQRLETTLQQEGRILAELTPADLEATWRRLSRG